MDIRPTVIIFAAYFFILVVFCAIFCSCGNSNPIVENDRDIDNVDTVYVESTIVQIPESDTVIIRDGDIIFYEIKKSTFEIEDRISVMGEIIYLYNCKNDSQDISKNCHTCECFSKPKG